ncbi:acyl-CoA dehydrogenase family protein [Streptomyces naphthomycinicus]|uniref:acyl-CoA dehydrogenase family protein n=1 Tax=Streptomyces naphthomycinicus TaxID=2872625 RepID=UPI001CED0F58|nr:acyl-CoA dehydrogenase family protein [Streptomyces sp. TML10]
MSWRGPVLDEEQRALASMLDALAATRERPTDEDQGAVAGLVAELAELGVWTLGTAEAAGGGGATRLTTAVAFERLGRTWPALGWAAVQAHAAVDVLAGDDRFTDLVGLLHGGSAAVAVVDAASAHVRLSWQGDRLVGAVDRVDAAHVSPHLLLLTGDDSGLLVPAESTTVAPVRRTGLDGALTRAVSVDAPGAAVRTLEGVDAAAARARLRLGAAAVAAGIAGAAADEALGYARSRRQFGGTLTEIPTVRQSLLAQAGRVTMILHAACAATGDPVQPAAAARAACDAAIEVTAAALQSHGGYGYLTEYPAERHLRDAVSLRAATDAHTTGVAAARALAGIVSSPALRKDAP